MIDVSAYLDRFDWYDDDPPMPPSLDDYRALILELIRERARRVPEVIYLPDLTAR